MAQGLAKRAIDEGLELSLADGLALERQLFVSIFETSRCRDRRALVPGERPGER